eukprot:Em0009g222a
MTYTIGQVNGYFPFVLNSTTGNFSVTQDVVYATQPHSYNFSVWCYDNLSPNLSSNASVTISVIEVDNYKPVITPSYVFLTVNETTPVGTVLASTRRDAGALSVYTATDMDVGPQGALHYNLYYSDPRFSGDGTFGTLTVQQSLNVDYIGATTFVNIIITARDPHVCSSDFTIILRQNDHYPMFSQKVYSVTYNDSTPPGQVIPSICTDQDIGVGALQGVVFLNTTPGVFLLNPSTGALTTNKSMDYTRARGCTVVLLCSDTGGLTNTSTVYVTITPHPNYTPLAFSSEGYVSKVSRTTPPLYIIGQIMAADAIIWSTTLTYKLQSNPYFIIDRLNGNLNSPVFTPGERSFDINELSPIGTSVATFQCTDADNGTNGQISNSIPGEWQHIWTMIQFLSTPLLLPYGVWIQQGAAQLCSRAVNKYHPQCMLIFNPTILDTTAVGSTVLQLSCSDADSGLLHHACIRQRISNTKHPIIIIFITFTVHKPPVFIHLSASLNLSDSIQSGLGTSQSVIGSFSDNHWTTTPLQTITASVGAFTAMSTYVVNTNKYDYMCLSTLYVVNVPENATVQTVLTNLSCSVANKGTVSDTFPVPRIISVTVYIFVQPVNTFFPVFQQSLYSYTIPENSPIGVTDRDSPASPDGQVTYSLVGLNQPKFTIDRSGWIILASNLDILQQAVYNFTVLAMDGGSGEYCGGRGSILETYYGFLIVSNASVTISVIEVDNVLTMSARCSAYALVVEKMTLLAGILLLFTACGSAGLFDPCFSLYLLIWSRTIIILNGSQAQPPTLTSPSNSVQVPETTAITVVGVAPSPRPPDGFLTVRCINHYNSSVGMTYTIGQVNGYFPFVLNSTTGSFSVTQDLVYATQPHSYNFSVWCYDNLSPNLSSNASVTISVMEVDKYKPVITPSYLFLTLNETTPLGTVLASTRRDVGALSVYTATDMDVGPQGVLFYILYYSDPRFSGDGTFGTLTVQQPLNVDYIGATTFINMIITACDPHVCSSDFNIYLTILRQNDHYPMFSQKVYSVTYNDSTPPGQVIPSICTDQDIGVGALQGVVFLNTTPGVFLLNPSTGVLITNISMDYRRARGYTVVLLCSDTGGLTNTSTVYVTITPPLIFSNAVYVFHILRSIPSPYTVGQVMATDVFTVLLTYSLTNNPYFIIDSLNGTIQTISSVFDYPYSEIVLNATVTDGLYNDTAMVYFILMDTNSPSPSPLLPTNTTQAEQTMIYIVAGIIAAAVLVVGVPILIMLILIWRRLKTHKAPGAATSIPVHTSAHRILKCPLHIASYATRIGNTEFKQNESVPNVFTIDANTGVVRVAAHLDHDTVPVYTMTVVAIRSVDPARSSSALLTIYGPGAQLVYTIMAGNGDGKFSILNNGLLTLVQGLNYANATQYQLVINVSDTFPVPRIISVTVYVSVQSVNTFSPVFQQSLYSYTIPENSPIGVTDRDSPASPDGQVTYSFVGLNQPKFTIDRSGWVILASNLDILQQAVYHFTVLAMDGVHCTDPVLGNTAPLHYSLDPSLSSSRYFNVDPNSGVITIGATLPSSSGHLTFRAICTGSAPHNLSDTTVMDVELLMKSNITFTPSASCLFLPPHTYNCGYAITYSLINYQSTFSIHPSSGYFKLIGIDLDPSDCRLRQA